MHEIDAFLNGDVLRPRSRQLYVYCDASEKGFGAVVYMRVTNERDLYVSFVMSKARVTRTKFLTIPRLEGAVVGVRLAGSACISLGISMADLAFWTDSRRCCNGSVLRSVAIKPLSQTV